MISTQMIPRHNNSVATEVRLRLMRDVAAPILRRKGTLMVTFLLVVLITLLTGYLRLQKYQPAGGAGANAVTKTQGNPSLNEAELDREAKLDERAEDLLVSNPGMIGLFAVVFGLLTSLATAYVVDYRDPCFHSPVQVIRTLGIPHVVAIPKRIL